jgi:uncharacterized protein (DUF305 family)
MRKKTTALAALTLASALALTACGGTETQGGAETTSAAATSAPATAGTETSPTTTGTETASPTGAAEEISAEHNNADVMFAQMMIPHHQQAVEMSETLLAKDGVPSEVADFAQQVIDAQGPEIDRMNAMLTTWGADPTPSSTGQGHGSPMKGMMSEDDLRQLEDAQGTEAARLYLEQMIHHHEGAVEMAREQVDTGQNPQAQELAQEVIDAQQAEIEQMRTMLDAL